MRGKVLASSLALTAIGAVVSGSFLDTKKLSSVFTGVSSVFSNKTGLTQNPKSEIRKKWGNCNKTSN